MSLLSNNFYYVHGWWRYASTVFGRSARCLVFCAFKYRKFRCHKRNDHNNMAFDAFHHILWLVLHSNHQDTQKGSPSVWEIDLDASERGEKVGPRCRLRRFNYWNYTLAPVKIYSDHQIESADGGNNFPSSHDGGVEPPPLKRRGLPLVALLNPFFSHFRNNYIFVKKSKSPTRILDNHCSLIFIYAQWCPFSMRAAPYINAIARLFPQLSVVAVDVDEYLRFRWSRRVFYVPIITILVGDRVNEFNGTDSNLDELVEFVWQNLRKLLIIQFWCLPMSVWRFGLAHSFSL